MTNLRHKISVNAVHSTRRFGNHLWFYHYANMPLKATRTKLPFCILNLQHILRVDVQKTPDRYITDFYYQNQEQHQRVEWPHCDWVSVYNANAGCYKRDYLEWRKETETKIQKALDLVGKPERRLF